MCGVAGIHSSRTDGRDAIRRMTDCMAHRGPDGEGVWSRDGMHLGHRRLAILDLSSTGDQPMLSANGRYVCVLNGEIYNYLELKEELVAKGVRTRGTSDTEVLLEHFVLSGRDVIPRLRGMFALAIWDIKAQELTLARDHFGKKPLYYTQDNASGMYFASELNALRQVVDTQLNPTQLPSFFHFGYIPEPQTIYAGVKALPAGAIGVYGPGRNLEVSRYWTPHELLSEAPSRFGDLDELEEQLKKAVARRLHSDVTLGSFLSGGVDSALIASILTEMRPGAPTVTIGFDQPQWDERDAAAHMARMLETDHCVEVVAMDDAETLFDQYMTCYDQPFADSSGIPTLVLAETARRHVSVALGGDGGDEVFGGYDRYRWFRSVRRSLSLPRSLRRLMSNILPVVAGDKGHRVARLLDTESPADAYHMLMSVWHATSLGELILNEPGKPGFAGFEEAPEHLVRANPQLIDMMNYLPFDILVKVDRATMRHGLESRSPFLDVDFVTWAARLGFLDAHEGEGKAALVSLLLRRHPGFRANQPKRGFMLPIPRWLKGPLRSRVLAAADASFLRRQGLFNVEAVERVVRRFFASDDQLAFPIWSLLVFQEWFMREQGRGLHE